MKLKRKVKRWDVKVKEMKIVSKRESAPGKDSIRWHTLLLYRQGEM
jgi:hypothetical protein